MMLNDVTVTIQRTIFEPDSWIFSIQGKRIEIPGNKLLNCLVFRQEWLKAFQEIIPEFTDLEWTNFINSFKAEVVQAKEVSEPVLIAQIFMEHARELSTTTMPATAYDMFLEKDGLLFLRLTYIRNWLYRNSFSIDLSTLSKVLVELDVKLAGMQVIDYADNGETSKSIMWAFNPAQVRAWKI